MDNYTRAYEIKNEIIKHRRKLHQIAEVGMELPKTAAYVKEQLVNMGYEPVELINSGIVATVGNGGKTFLLRADMDALPVKEESGLDFASVDGNCHACGHDAHTAVLLGAAKMLKEQEADLKGTVKLMFQPGEELLTGAGAMIEAGLLDNPKVDCAMALHIRSTDQAGISYLYGSRSASSNNFIIRIKGVAAHGAMPYNGVDPIVTGAHIVLGLQELISREISFAEGAVLTFGQFAAGNSCNSIPAHAELKGTMRSFSNKTREYLKKRIPEIVADVAKTYRAAAELEWLCDIPVLVNDNTFTDQIVGYLKSFSEEKFTFYEGEPTTGSEDFALIANKVPSCMFSLAAPDPNSDVKYALHNPRVIFDEDCFPMGSTALVESAVRWLENNF